jgi:hypothetical protein
MYKGGHQAAPPWPQNMYFRRENIKDSAKGLVYNRLSHFLTTDQHSLMCFKDQRLCMGRKKKEFTFLGCHMTTSVRICVFEAQKFVHLRAIFGNFPDTKYRKVPGAYIMWARKVITML